ncbi:50S ribosomal protein L24 [bacterium]|nr:50S ribosomal protein L24 [bacterium]
MAARIKVGDRIRVIAGNDRGKEGEVARIMWKRGLIIVKGVALRTRHRKADARTGQGGEEEISGAVAISNVMPLDAQGEPTRVRFQKVEGRSVRVSVRSGKMF